MMHGWNGWMGWGGGFGVLWMLLLLGLTVAAAVALTRTLLPRSGAARDEDDALSVLRARFARGEIDEDEFRARRAILTSTPGGRP
jgi:putative membrane protein